MEHTVRKSKLNRIAMRFTAMIFLVIGIVSFVVMTGKSRGLGRLLFMVLCAGCITYGLILFLQTLKAQAYDITYVFGDKQMTLKMHRQEKTYAYSDITELSYIVPNDNMDYGVVQIFFGKNQYVIPFMGNKNVGEALYGMLEIKRNEANERNNQE